MKNVIASFLGFAMLAGTTALCAEQSISDKNVVLLPVKNDPTISFRIWFKVGSQNDPVGKEGLANITAAMLADASTKKNNYETILDKLYPLAAEYKADTSVEMTVLYGRVHKDNLKDYYPLFTDAILNPAFKQDDLDRIKSKVSNYLENTLRYASDEELGKAVLYDAVFRGTPYGHIAEGRIASVKSISLDDVRHFYEKHFTRDNVVIGIGGGYDKALVQQLVKDISRLPGGEVREPAAPKPAPMNDLNAIIVGKDATATAISMGFPIDVLRGTKDWYALAIASSWFGEHRNSSSHLYQVIREKRGLNYGDYSYIENFPNGGELQMPPQNVARRRQLFEIWIRPVPNETRLFALRAALREYQHLVEQGLTEDEFSLTRSFLRKYVLHYAPTTMERLGYALDDRFYGIRGSHLEIFRKMMETLTLADVNRAIRKHLQYGNMQIAIVTKDAGSLKEALVSDAPSPIAYKTPKPESITKEDEQISTFPLKVKPENIRIVPVAELFEK
jgi:zinc protease